MGLSNKRPHRRNYAVNKKAANTGGKIKNTISLYAKLKSRLLIEGETLWLKNAMKFAEVKLKKYSIKF